MDDATLLLEPLAQQLSRAHGGNLRGGLGGCSEGRGGVAGGAEVETNTLDWDADCVELSVAALCVAAGSGAADGRGGGGG
eukprot:220537-Chlamydomonas_euryale.AAC.1